MNESPMAKSQQISWRPIELYDNLVSDVNVQWKFYGLIIGITRVQPELRAPSRATICFKLYIPILNARSRDVGLSMTESTTKVQHHTHLFIDYI